MCDLELFSKIRSHIVNGVDVFHLPAKDAYACALILLLDIFFTKEEQCGSLMYHSSRSSKSALDEKGTIYLDNLNFASALVLSGNNYRRVTMFHGYQRNNICPAVDTFYKQEQVRILLQVVACLFDFILLCKYRKKLIDQVKNKDVILSGDGRCDSPGKSALIQLWISTLITYCTLKL